MKVVNIRRPRGDKEWLVEVECEGLDEVTNLIAASGTYLAVPPQGSPQKSILEEM